MFMDHEAMTTLVRFVVPSRALLRSHTGVVLKDSDHPVGAVKLWCMGVCYLDYGHADGSVPCALIL